MASTITLASFAVAALVSVPAAALQSGWPSVGAHDLAAAVYTGFVTAGVAYLLYTFALHHVRPATAVTLALTEPLVAFELAVTLLGEAASAVALGGLALVVAGVWGVVRSEVSAHRSARPRASPRTSETAPHEQTHPRQPAHPENRA